MTDAFKSAMINAGKKISTSTYYSGIIHKMMIKPENNMYDFNNVNHIENYVFPTLKDNEYRAMKCYIQYLKNEPMKGGNKRKNNNDTIYTFVKKLQNRESIRNFLWLVIEKNFSITTSFYYTIWSRSTAFDINCNVIRAKNAFKNYPTELSSEFDNVFHMIYNDEHIFTYYNSCEQNRSFNTNIYKGLVPKLN